MVDQMADKYNIPIEDVEKYQKYATHLLVDIKILFIVTYVYISVVNLISTTANNEANLDAESTLRFNITSRPEHTDVIVEYVDDAVLWKCRDQSLTRSYYVTMYWMLLAMLIATLGVYLVSKFLALCNIDYFESRTDLWHLGILELMLEEKNDLNPVTAKETAKHIQGLLDKDIPKNGLSEVLECDLELNCIMWLRKIIPFVSLFASVFALAFCILSYDLHSVSCIAGISEDFINYDNTTHTVELRFPDEVITFQQIGAVIAFFLVIAILDLALVFYLSTKYITNKMKDHAVHEINDFIRENTCNVEENTRNVEENTSNMEENTSNMEESTSIVEENTSSMEENTSNVEENTRNVEESRL